MDVAQLKVYDFLKIKLGDQEAEMLISYIETKAEKKEIDKTLSKEEAKLLSTKEDLYKLGTSLEVKIESSKTEILRWYIYGMLGSISTTVLLVKLLFS